MKNLLALSAIIVVVFVLWDQSVLYPLKLLVVFFHESSHAIATVLTGGHVKEMTIDPRLGGKVLSVGGNRFLTLSAGYLGSLVWGSVIYLLAVRTRFDKLLMAVLGVSVIAMAVVFAGDSFALGFSALVGGVMIISAWLVPLQINDFVLRLIGMVSMLYAPLDIYSDTIQRSHLKSDAFMLAEKFGGTTVIWGSVWIIISALLILITIKLSMVKQEKPVEQEPVD